MTEEERDNRKKIFRESPIIYAETFGYPGSILGYHHRGNSIYEKSGFYRSYADIVSLVGVNLKKIENDIFS